MNSPFIRLQSINLHYDSVAFKERSLKSLLAGWLGTKSTQPAVRDVHALKDISIEIKGGERLGLLGHNGAGKSTFLRALAGLYPISSGQILIKGEIRSLFDLSLGFEPDATGRENILYRGLLLGLTPHFMNDKQSEIVEFAGLGDFIDYPIKTYSAGMQVRLAFAISTIVGGDILLLDEVLGAGDASFMAKAKQRIAGLIERAEILVLASHDFGALQTLCTRGIVFHHGTIIYDGSISTAVVEYRKANGL